MTRPAPTDRCLQFRRPDPAVTHFPVSVIGRLGPEHEAKNRLKQVAQRGVAATKTWILFAKENLQYCTAAQASLLF